MQLQTELFHVDPGKVFDLDDVALNLPYFTPNITTLSQMVGRAEESETLVGNADGSQVVELTRPGEAPKKAGRASKGAKAAELNTMFGCVGVKTKHDAADQPEGDEPEPVDKKQAAKDKKAEKVFKARAKHLLS